MYIYLVGDFKLAEYLMYIYCNNSVVKVVLSVEVNQSSAGPTRNEKKRPFKVLGDRREVSLSIGWYIK